MRGEANQQEARRNEAEVGARVAVERRRPVEKMAAEEVAFLGVASSKNSVQRSERGGGEVT